MTKSKLLKLKVGDKVTLAVDCSPYGYWNGSYHRIKVPAGTVGLVGSVKVPSVRREGVYFVCVDFPHDVKLSEPVSNPHKNNFRVGALPEELV